MGEHPEETSDESVSAEHSEGTLEDDYSANPDSLQVDTMGLDNEKFDGVNASDIVESDEGYDEDNLEQFELTDEQVDEMATTENELIPEAQEVLDRLPDSIKENIAILNEEGLEDEVENRIQEKALQIAQDKAVSEGREGPTDEEIEQAEEPLRKEKNEFVKAALLAGVVLFSTGGAIHSETAEAGGYKQDRTEYSIQRGKEDLKFEKTKKALRTKMIRTKARYDSCVSNRGEERCGKQLSAFSKAKQKYQNHAGSGGHHGGGYSGGHHGGGGYDDVDKAVHAVNTIYHIYNIFR